MQRVPWLVVGTVVPAVDAAAVLVASLPPGRAPAARTAPPVAAVPATTSDSTAAPTVPTALPMQPAGVTPATPVPQARTAVVLAVTSTDVSFETRADLTDSPRSVDAVVWYPT